MLPLTQAFGELEISLFNANGAPSRLAQKLDSATQRLLAKRAQLNRPMDTNQYQKYVSYIIRREEVPEDAGSFKSLQISRASNLARPSFPAAPGPELV